MKEYEKRLIQEKENKKLLKKRPYKEVKQLEEDKNRFYDNKYSYRHIWNGITITEGITYSIVFSHVLYKHFYFLYDCKNEKVKELVFQNDDYWYQGDNDFLLSGLTSSQTLTGLRQMMKEGLIHFYNGKKKSKGKYTREQTRYITVKDIKGMYNKIKESTNILNEIQVYGVNNGLENYNLNQLNKSYKEFKQKQKEVYEEDINNTSNELSDKFIKGNVIPFISKNEMLETNKSNDDLDKFLNEMTDM